MKSYRIDPTNKNGIHIVDAKNGGERVFIFYSEINGLIDELRGCLNEV